MKLFLLPLLATLSFTALAQEGSSSTNADQNDRQRIGLAIEPMIIYAQEEGEIKTSGLPVISDDTSATSTGVGFGLKLGGHVGSIVTAGVDGRYLRTRFQDSAYGAADSSKYTVGPTVGVQMPVAGLRLWGTYVPFGQYDPQAGNRGFDVRFQEPQGYRVGAGFHIGPVSLNLEYENIKFNQTKLQSLGDVRFSSNSDINYDSQSWNGSVSFPLEL